MLQGYREKKASRALVGSKGLLGLTAVREKRGMLDQRVPEVPFLLYICFTLFFILTLLFNTRLEISCDEVVRLLMATPSYKQRWNFASVTQYFQRHWLLHLEPVLIKRTR